MSNLLSKPIENLIFDRFCEKSNLNGNKDVDVLIVGSGYGGAIAAMRLAQEGRSVWVFERGKEYMPGEFPETIGDLPGDVRFLMSDRNEPTGYVDALFDFRIGNEISFLVGNGLGGGSLINANVALAPDFAIFDDPRWPATFRLESTQNDVRGAIDKIRDLLGVDEDQKRNSKGRGKYPALERVAGSLGTKCRPAPITVTQKTEANYIGVEQQACIGCANCVTGCNVGAKNTLAMNALPLAASRGTELYTGVTVLSVEPVENGSNGWKVRFRITAVNQGKEAIFQKEVYTLHAGVVILAAGTLGSTEILLRSQARGRAHFSQLLGKRISGNGDTLAFGYAQRQEVNAVANADIIDPVPRPFDKREIGPSISGYFQVTPPGTRRPVTVEDCAIPEALAHAFGEIITTAALPKRYIKKAKPAWFVDHPDADPLTVQPDALRNSQMLLVMGDDCAPWKAELRCSENNGLMFSGTPDLSMRGAPDYDQYVAHVVRDAPPNQDNSVFNGIDAMLKAAENRTDCFDGGDYLPNPLWKLIPDELMSLTKTAPPVDRLLSVHPLGGCVMGDDRDHGVVDKCGRVYDGNAPSKCGAYTGLYVMDGAIIPSALGVNPLLTISALAYLNAEHVHYQLATTQCPGIGKANANSLFIKGVNQSIKDANNSVQSRRMQVREYNVAATFKETLFGKLSVDTVPTWLEKILDLSSTDKEKLKENGLVVSVEIKIPSVIGWLRAPNKSLTATASLYLKQTADADTIDDWQLQGEPLARGDGRVELFALDRPGKFCHWCRALSAIGKFVVKRTEDFIQEILNLAKPGGQGFVNAFIQYCRVASNHSNWRRLHYWIRFESKNRGRITLDGTKLLAYALGLSAPWDNPWSAVVDLPIELRDEGGSGCVTGLLHVDVIRMTRRAPLQVTRSPNEPISLASMISVGTMALRTMFQTHFWSFGAPNYPGQPILPVPSLACLTFRDPGSLDNVSPEFIDLCVPSLLDPPAPDSIKIRLAHYKSRNADIDKGSVLFIHGIASCSKVFATDTVDESFATYFCRRGYDVWLLDHRFSTALPDVIPGKWLTDNPWTMDHAAAKDIPAAIKYIYQTTNNQPVNIFAHCIGAGATEMAILGGHCQDGHKSMIKSLAVHAVHPWPIPSELNYVRNNVAVFLKNVVSQTYYDPILPDDTQATTTEVVFDRIAGSLPWRRRCETARHRWETDSVRMGRQICNRITLLYGYQWRHEHIACKTHRALATLLGGTDLEVWRQIYYILLQERLVNRQGQNAYVKADRFQDYWRFPTLFAHGRDNMVFNYKGARQSFNRLDHLRGLLGDSRERGQRGVYWFEAPDYGHMDFLFGKNANKDIYPNIEAFFNIENPADRDIPAALTRLPPDSHSQTDTMPPTCGPVIGWARSTNPKNVVLRLWLEPYVSTDATSLDCVADRASIGIDEVQLPSPPTRDSNGKEYPYPGIYRVYDVELNRVDQDQDLYITLTSPYDPDTFAGIRQNTFAVTTMEGRELQTIKLEWRRGQQKGLATPDNELHDSKGVRIPLSQLPWFKRLLKSDEGELRQMGFAVSCCLYPGSPFEAELSDAIFEGILHHVEKFDKEKEGIDHVLMIGDQIYADANADIFDTRVWNDLFATSYREAYGGKYLRRMLACVPTYMALDDHEWRDNYPGMCAYGPADVLQNDCLHRGLAAAKAYQWSMNSHTGASGTPFNSCKSGRDFGLWYEFESGGLPFFVMETRTERVPRREDVKPQDAFITCDRQMDDLKNWLVKVSKSNMDKPKFVVSGSVLGLATKAFTDNPLLWRNCEEWAGYPGSWQDLAEFIVSKQIQNIVFIGGDLHFSALSQLTLIDKNRKYDQVVAYQIIASGFYVPLPFANEQPGDYYWGKGNPSHKLPLPKAISPCKKVNYGNCEIEVEAYLLTTKYAHFLRVDAQKVSTGRWSLTVRACGPNGKSIKIEDRIGGPFKSEGNHVNWEL